MRTTFRTLSAAFLAALFALASCDKSDIAENGVQQQTGGSRVIAVSFQNNSTKTILDTDGLTPKFEANDQIKVANSIDAPEICTVSVEGDVATITTTLTGTLTMVYPASAAKMNGNAIDGVLVPTEQDGTFASANICMAEIAENATEATFENQTAVFKLFVPENADAKGAAYTLKSVAIKSIGENNIADGSKEITVGDGTASVADADGYCYVSLLPGESFKNLDVCVGAGLRTLSGEAVLSANSLYSVALPVLNGYEYVEIAGKKWATMNVGATTVAGSASTCYGEYFAWGATEPYYTSISFTSANAATINGWKSGKEDGYDWPTAPFNNGSSDYNSDYFTTNKSEWLTDNVLKPAYDAATVNWGSSWRMPTVEDFKSLWTACTGDEEEWYCEPAPLPETITDGGVYWSDSYDGVAGILFVDKSDISKRVFFPAAGHVYGTSFGSGGADGYSWSSSLNTDDPDYAYRLCFYDWYVGPSSSSGRYVGFTVRPFSE